jgi:transcriptional regulator with XRE-family HTH domain
MLLRGLIGTVLRRTRLGQNRTLRDVAERARVSVPYLSEVERGRKEPSSELLAAICDALDLELTDLLGEVRYEIARDRTARPVTSTTMIITGPGAGQEQSLQGSVMVGGSFDPGYGGGLGSVMVAA